MGAPWQTEDERDEIETPESETAETARIMSLHARCREEGYKQRVPVKYCQSSGVV